MLKRQYWPVNAQPKNVEATDRAYDHDNVKLANGGARGNDERGTETGCDRAATGGTNSFI